MSPKLLIALVLSILVVHFSFCVWTNLLVQPARPSCNSTLTTLGELQAAAINQSLEKVTSQQNDDSEHVPHSVEYIATLSWSLNRSVSSSLGSLPRSYVSLSLTETLQRATIPSRSPTLVWLPLRVSTLKGA